MRDDIKGLDKANAKFNADINGAIERLKVVPFLPDDGDQAAIVDLLEDALAKAKAGEVRDVAIVLAIRDEDGPQFWHGYYGEVAYATILAGLSALEFDLHYRRYVPAED